MNYYGIEVELERVREALDMPPNGWIITGDGSLRDNGIEFVFNGPKPLDTVEALLHRLQRHLEEYAPDASASHRCSTHIHMDVRDLSIEEMLAVLINYELIEPMLFRSVAQDREDSHFCVPHYMTKRRNGDAAVYLRDFELDALYRETNKYSSLNLRTIRSLTTMEWRQFPAILPVWQAMYWVDIIDDFKENTRKWGRWNPSLVQELCDKWFGGADQDLLDMGTETAMYTQDSLEFKGDTNHIHIHIQDLKDRMVVSDLRSRIDEENADREAIPTDDDKEPVRVRDAAEAIMRDIEISRQVAEDTGQPAPTNPTPTQRHGEEIENAFEPTTPPELNTQREGDEFLSEVRQLDGIFDINEQ